MSGSDPSRPAATEKWWHRFLRVPGYGFTLLVLAVSLIIYIEDAEYYTYTYSFESNYAEGAGYEYDCYAYESLGSISCGGFEDGEEFIEYFLSVKGNDKLKDGQRSVNDYFVELRSQGHSDRELAVSLISDKDYKYRRQSHWDHEKLVIAVLSALGVTIVFFVAMFALYKIILFVVHGHTRIVRGTGGAF